MTVKEFIKLAKYDKYQQVAFMVAKAHEDERTPFYHAEYHESPWTSVADINEAGNYWQDFIVLNDEAHSIPWLSGVNWENDISSGILKMMLVISREDLNKLYSVSQAEHMEKFIGDKIKDKYKKTRR